MQCRFSSTSPCVKSMERPLPSWPRAVTLGISQQLMMSQTLELLLPRTDPVSHCVPSPWHRSSALHLLCSLVLGLLHQRVLGIHHAQNLVDVGLQPGHDSRVLPQGVCPAHVQGCQLVQGGRLAMGDGCYSRHPPPPPPPPVPHGMLRAQLCALAWEHERTRKLLPGYCHPPPPDLLPPSIFRLSRALK